MPLSAPTGSNPTPSVSSSGPNSPTKTLLPFPCHLRSSCSLRTSGTRPKPMRKAFAKKSAPPTCTNWGTTSGWMRMIFLTGGWNECGAVLKHLVCAFAPILSAMQHPQDDDVLRFEPVAHQPAIKRRRQHPQPHDPQPDVLGAPPTAR